MPWSSYDGERLCFSRGKTAVPVDLPGHERLKSILRETPRLSPIIVTTTKGNPYSPDGFSGAFRKVIKALEVSGKVAKGLTVHGLRHTVGSRLADARATTREIMAYLGHETEAMAQHYTRGADRRRNATAAIRKLEGGRKG
jgi:integrase